MRKIKLFIAALALVGGSSAMAQTWTPSPVGEGTFYLYNVGAGKYLCSGNNWGSHASVTEGGIPVTLAGNGTYTISTAAIYAGKYLEGEWMDGGAAMSWTFEEVTENVYKIKNGDNVLFWNGGTSTNNTVGADPGTDAAKWMLVTEENRIADMANATEESPMDVTFLIKNAYFAKGNGRIVAANTDLTDSPSWKGTSLTDLWGYDAGTEEACYAVEQYGKQFDNYQELSVPNGKYFMTAKGFYRGSVIPYIYANNEKCDLKVKGELKKYDGTVNDGIESGALALRGDDYLLDGVTVIVTDGILRVGVKSDASIDWSVFDDFHLTYYGPVVDLSILAENLATQVAIAEALYEKIPEAAKYELGGVINEYNKTYTTATEYENAINAIEAAINTYSPLVEPYQKLLDRIQEAEVLISTANDNSEATMTAATSLTAADNHKDQCTDVAAINNVFDEVTMTMMYFVSEANPLGEGVQFDCTFMLKNPDVTPFWTNTWNVRPEGWYNDQNIANQNFQVMANEKLGPGGEVFMEYWAPSPATDGFVLYQKVTLPEGTYKMTGRVAANFDGQGGTIQNVYFAANDVLGTRITSETLMDASIEFVQSAEGLVKIGMKVTEGNEARWMAINKIHLYKVPAKTIELDEDLAFTPEDVAGTVTLKKTIYEGWNTIALPFGIQPSDLVAALPMATLGQLIAAGYTAADVALYKFVDADGGELQFESASAINPHTPYLFKFPTTLESITLTFNGVTISEGTPITEGTDYNFVGTYVPYAKNADDNPIVAAADYILGDDAAFHKTTVKNALKAFRAYIQANEATPEGGARMLINIDGVTTAIEAIDGQSVNTNANIYNLNGQQVKNAQKGLYIQNGKKYVVK